MVKQGFFIILVLLVCMSCQKQDLTQKKYEFDTEYFPLLENSWKIYKVQYISVDVNSSVYDTSNYFLKEVQTNWFTNVVNDSMLRLERFYKDSLHHSWKELSVWQMGIHQSEAIVVEDNIMFVKLKFPLLLNATWNGDSYNRLDTLQKYTYKVAEIHNSYSMGTYAFDSVLTVSQKEQSSLVEKVSFEEKYAYKLGLIYKKQVDVYSSRTEDAQIPIEKRVTKGTLYYQELINYGHD